MEQIDLVKQAQEYFEQVHYKKVYPGAKELIRFLRKKDYLVIAISRAFEECLLPLQKYLGISLVIGTRFEYKKGGATGKLLNTMWKAGSKEKELMEIFKKKNLTTEDSIALGDTEDDFYMMKFVEFPISVNANRALEKMANQRHWPIYRNLVSLFDDLQSEKFFPKVDWYQHYREKYARLIMDDSMFEKSLINDRPFVNVVKRWVKPGTTILEAGTGLGRTAISLSRAGFKVKAIDNNEKMLQIARINCQNYGESVQLYKTDLFDIDQRFKPNQLSAITHGGVLEHYEDSQVRIILDMQLKIAPIVIFSVPIKSKRNDNYFQNDQIGHRNLWTQKQWINFLQHYYQIKEMRKTRSLRKDDLIVVIAKKT
jgi:phosphoserine phosphatase